VGNVSTQVVDGALDVTNTPVERSQGPVLGVGLTSVRAYENSYLVDPASSHMLVSKIKPCMSKYKQIYTVKLRMAH
jgi:hypothetical protein